MICLFAATYELVPHCAAVQKCTFRVFPHLQPPTENIMPQIKVKVYYSKRTFKEQEGFY